MRVLDTPPRDAHSYMSCSHAFSRTHTPEQMVWGLLQTPKIHHGAEILNPPLELWAATYCVGICQFFDSPVPHPFVYLPPTVKARDTGHHPLPTLLPCSAGAEEDHQARRPSGPGSWVSSACGLWDSAFSRATIMQGPFPGCHGGPRFLGPADATSRRWARGSNLGRSDAQHIALPNISVPATCGCACKIEPNALLFM